MKIEDVTKRFLELEAPRRYSKHGRVGRRAMTMKATMAQFCAVEIPADRLFGRKATQPSGSRRVGNVDGDDFQAADLDDFLDNLSRRLIKGRPISITTVNDYRTNVITVLRWASRRAKLIPSAAMVEAQATDRIKPGRTPARRKKEVQPVEEADFRGLIAWLRDHAERLPAGNIGEQGKRLGWQLTIEAMLVHWESGMRRHELVQMRHADLRSHRDANSQKLSHYYVPPSHKTEHADNGECRIWLSQLAWQAITRAVEFRRLGGGNQYHLGFAFDSDARLWPWQADNPDDAAGCYYRKLNLAINLYNKEAGAIVRFTPHQIRHSFADRNAPKDLLGTQAQMGHRHLSTTQRYIHQKDRAARSLVDPDIPATLTLTG